MIVGRPPVGGALKKERGELILTGEEPGIWTRAVPVPWPTSASPQRLRAGWGVVPSSFAIAQVGSPLVSTKPFLSSSKVSVFRAGGIEPSLVPIRVVVESRTGAPPWAGSERGRSSAVALTTVLPISARIAYALAAAISAAAAARSRP